MSPTAIVLILVAAMAHASWNLFSKQAAAAGAVCFVWLFFTAAAVLYAPVAVIVLVVSHPRLAGLPIVFMAGTAIIHIGYALLLQNGYRLGDLSVVYPIGRGSGALLAVVAGIALLGERPGPLSMAGILLVIAGAVVIGLPGRARNTSAALPPAAVKGIAFALLTGLTVAASCREVSVLFGVLLGGRLLGEGGAVRRLAAAVAIVAGIISVAVA